MTNNQDLYNDLVKYALQISKPFCYNCYKIAESGTCEHCHSDDLMRHVEDYGMEYGTKWIIEDVILNKFTEIDFDEKFEEYLYERYSDRVSICGVEYDPVSFLKNNDRDTYNYLQSEYVHYQTEDEEEYFCIKEDEYFETREIREFLKIYLE